MPPPRDTDPCVEVYERCDSLRPCGHCDDCAIAAELDDDDAPSAADLRAADEAEYRQMVIDWAADRGV